MDENRWKYMERGKGEEEEEVRDKKQEYLYCRISVIRCFPDWDDRKHASVCLRACII